MGNPDPTDPAPLRAALAASLRADGFSDRIVEAFARVSRHVFLPDQVWTEDRRPVHRVDQPEAWMRLAYADAPVTTQRDDGQDGGPGIASSSSSGPSIMAAMLTAADLQPGRRVLEIGTGTGYNTALLCTLLGADNVTTIEIDEQIAAQARTTLDAAGHQPTVITGDGSLGHPDGAPFDRTIATCTVAQIPDSWITQTRDNGMIITPWSPAPSGPGGVLAALTVLDDVAEGHFVQGLSFMWLRSQRGGFGAPHDLDSAPDSTEHTDSDPTRPLLDGAELLPLTLMVPAWRFGMRPGAGGGLGVWLSATDSPSWSRLLPAPRGGWSIEQGGPRRLWDEIKTAHHWWRQHGRPAVSAYGLTVDPHGHSVWLGDPTGPSWRHAR